MTFSATVESLAAPGPRTPPLKAISQNALVTRAVTTAVMRMTVPRASFLMHARTYSGSASFPTHGADSDRLLGLELQALARAFLSHRPAATALVRLLRRPFRYGRNQQQLLSASF